MTKLDGLKFLVDKARLKKIQSHDFVVMYEEKLQRAKMVYHDDDSLFFAKQLEYEAELKRLGILG
jgi:hypothetical protein